MYVTIKQFSKESGYTENAIYNKINRGVWMEGHEYMTAPDGRKLINTEGYQKWVEQGVKNALPVRQTS